MGGKARKQPGVYQSQVYDAVAKVKLGRFVVSDKRSLATAKNLAELRYRSFRIINPGVGAMAGPFLEKGGETKEWDR